LHVSCLIGNPGNDAYNNQYNCLLFIIILPVTECAHDAEEKKENAKREFG